MAKAKADIVEKKRLLIDGDEWEGLVNIAEYALEEVTVEVPGQDTIVTVKSGKTKIPPIDVIYKIRRDSNVLTKIRDWKNKFEYHDVTCIRSDASGKEFSRELWTSVECSKMTEPAYDAANPPYAQVTATMLPENIIPIAAEG